MTLSLSKNEFEIIKKCKERMILKNQDKETVIKLFSMGLVYHKLKIDDGVIWDVIKLTPKGLEVLEEKQI